MIRARALGLIAAATALPACARSNAVSVGSKNFTEQLILGEMYAQILERDGISVGRKLNLGGTQIAMAALRKGEIDLYPEYTGTALLTVLHLPAQSDGAAIYATVKREYQRQFGLTWLAPAPMNDTQALATTQAIAQRYDMRTLSKLSVVAPQLRLGAIPEFTTREDGLPGLQRAYGGFRFKDVRLFDIGLKYKALLTGNVDVVVAFGTDGQIAADDLVVLRRRPALLAGLPGRAGRARRDAARVSEDRADARRARAALTDATMRQLNDAGRRRQAEPADVARAFLTLRTTWRDRRARSGFEAVTRPLSRRPTARPSTPSTSTCRAGALVVLLGPSGCGKSTLAAHGQPARRRRRAARSSSTGRRARRSSRRRCGAASATRSRRSACSRHMTVAANVAVVPELLGWNRPRIDARVDELLALVRLDPARYRDRLPRELSGGGRSASASRARSRPSRACC